MASEVAPAPGPSAGQSIITHPLVHQAVLLALVLFTFWDAFWAAPRLDQLVYLYEAAQFPSFPELLVRSPSWNRSVSLGDHVLFRPVLYLLLAAEYGLFGYRFGLWQGVGITLHAALTLLVYRLARRYSPETPQRHLLLAGLFATITISSEAVIWHHITGYVLFALCAAGSASSLLNHLETGRLRPAMLAVLLALLATFTYEFGAFYCAVIGLALAWSARRVASRADRNRAVPSGRWRLGLALCFWAIPVLYGAVSLADLLARFGGIEHSDGSTERLWNVARQASPATLLHHVGYQLAFWFGGVLMPAVYDVHWGQGRTFIAGFRWSTEPWLLLNILAAGALVAGAAGLLAPRFQAIRAGELQGVLLGGGLLILYALMITVGRSIPRTLPYTTIGNLYYVYVPGVILFLSLAAAAAGRKRAGGSPSGEAPATSRVICRALLVAGLVGLIVANARATRELTWHYRYLHAAPRLELLHHAREWHQTRAPGAYFVVSSGCPGNDRLHWFGGYLWHDADAPYFLDVLYPATSYNLNRRTVPSAAARVSEISCDGQPLDPSAILGTWRAGRSRATIRPAGDGRLLLGVDTPDASSAGTLLGRRVVARDWNRSGLVSHDGTHIFWEDRSTWSR